MQESNNTTNSNNINTNNIFRNRNSTPLAKINDVDEESAISLRKQTAPIQGPSYVVKPIQPISLANITATPSNSSNSRPNSAIPPQQTSPNFIAIPKTANFLKDSLSGKSTGNSSRHVSSSSSLLSRVQPQPAQVAPIASIQVTGLASPKHAGL